MKISTRTRYGLRAMIELALHYGEGPASVREIADSQALPPKYLEQLLGALRSGGLVTALRGASGGYVLVRSPAQITLADVFTVLEGSLAPVECVDLPDLCPHEEDCVTRIIWVRLNEAIHQVLDEMTLADLASASRAKGDKGEHTTCSSAEALQSLLGKETP